MLGSESKGAGAIAANWRYIFHSIESTIRPINKALSANLVDI
jgi:hypothetical protein